MSTDDEMTYTPVKQVIRFNIESVNYYPPTVWQLIALHIGETLEKHGCIIVPGQSLDLSPVRRRFGHWILKFELTVMNGQSYYGHERMMSEIRMFTAHAGAIKFESDFENVR